MKNEKRNKFLSLLLSFAMLVSVLPVNVLAEGIENKADVVQGYYDDNGTWKEGELKQDLPNGIESVQKNAKKIGKNEYEITLEVKTKQKKIVVNKKAATVLVIDTSGSMNEDGRLISAKTAAKDFIETYAGKSADAERYLAIVTFNKGSEIDLNWIDVSKQEGKNKALNTIDGIKADGGTNLQAGLKYSNVLFEDAKVKDVDKEHKNTIVLTDGAPTYYLEDCTGENCYDKLPIIPIPIKKDHIKIDKDEYHVLGEGSSGSKEINNYTNIEAKDLKAKSGIYTICYGAKDQETYIGGPTVGEYLKDDIATSEGNAYNADDSEKLNEVFKNITDTIISGLTGKNLEVVDQSTEFISISGLPENIKEDGNGFTWKLGETKPEEENINGETIYTYRLKYEVKIDENNNNFEEGKYYPLNGNTYIVLDGKKIKFPIPAAKGEKTVYNIKYTDGVEGEDIFEDKVLNGKLGETTPKFEGKLERKGYIFVGWENTDKKVLTEKELESVKVTKDEVYTAVWEEDRNGNEIPDKEEKCIITYTDGVEGKEIFKDQKKKVLVGERTPKYEGKLERKGYIFVGWDWKEGKKPLKNEQMSQLIATGNATYKAVWEEDANENGIPDKEEKCIITYTDGVEGKEIFKDQKKEVLVGERTPKYEGKLERKGYIFVGWDWKEGKKPLKNEQMSQLIATGNATYKAIWEEDANENGIPDKEEKCIITYTDGVEGKEIFKDQKKEVLVGERTPKYEGKLERKGYIFVGWDWKEGKKPLKNEQMSQLIATGNATYKAIWEEDANENGIPDKEEKCIITYTDGVEGKEIFKDQKKEVLVGERTPKYEGKLERKGYIFVGWDWKEGKKPLKNEQMSQLIATGNATYKAVWEEDANENGIPDKEEKCIITYTDGVEGKEIFKDQKKEVLVGERTPKYEGKLERKGYIFVGWDWKEGKKPLKNEQMSQLIATGNATYKAIWEEDVNENGIPDSQEQKYMVSYTDGTEKEEVFKNEIHKGLVKGEARPIFTNNGKGGKPERKGYIFAGWSPKLEKEVTRTVVYTALWDKDANNNGVADKNEKGYKITYKDGFEGKLFNTVTINGVKEGTITPKFKGNLELKYYIFVGWENTDKKVLTEKELESVKVTKDEVYTAVWEKDKNGNEIPDSQEQKYMVSYTDGTEKEEVFKNEIHKGLLKGEARPIFTNNGKGGKPERKGYIFAGWSPKLEKEVTRTVVYTALWDKDANNNGIADKNEKGYKITYKDGFEGKLFNTVTINGVKEGTITPKFKGNLELKYYIFVGWENTDKKVLTEKELESVKVTKDEVYTAVWEEDKNGNEIPDSQEQKYMVSYTDGTEKEEVFKNEIHKGLLKGEARPIFTNNGKGGKPERKGYIFAGWSPELEKEVTRTVVYTALWDRDANNNGVADKNEKGYKITYKDGFEGKVFDTVTINNVKEGTITPKFKGNLELKYYIFVGWENTDKKVLTEKELESVKVRKDEVYTAVWEEDRNGNEIPDSQEQKYTVTYTDGVENEDIFVDQVYEGLLKDEATPKFEGKVERNGYVFVGWEPDVSDLVIENATYIAKWEEDKNGDGRPDKDEKYTITYTDGVENEVIFEDQENKDIPYGAKTPIFVGTPERRGYTFKGWSPRVEETVLKDMIYTAQWSKNEVVPNIPSVPSIPSKPNDPNRIEGHDRIETAVEASKNLYPGGTDSVVIANCERYTDVLTANPFAIQNSSSVLFTYKDKLPEKTLKEIERLGAKKIYVSGGYEAVSKKVVNQLINRGYTIYRFDGKNRYDTARKIAIEIRKNGNKNVVELASGEDYPDALSMTSMAVKDNAPILLTKKDSIPMDTKKALAEWDVENIKIAGLYAAISKDIEKQIAKGFAINANSKEDNNIYDGAKSVLRFGGANRYETSTIIAKNSRPESRLGVYATGEDFPDALIAGNYAGRRNAPVLLVKKNTLPAVVDKYTRESKIEKVTVIGGVNAISDYVFDLLKAAVK